MTTREASRLLVSLLVALNLVSVARAHSTCTSPLTADQLRELDVMIFPGHPFSR